MLKKNDIRVLLVEDQQLDAELIIREVKRLNLDVVSKRVETESDFINELETFNPDIILSDYRLPSFDGISALALASEISPEIPFIIVSGTIGEEKLINIFQSGATDYVCKDRLEKLLPSLHRALREAQVKVEKADNEANLYAMIENTDNAIWSVATDYKLLSFNSIFKKYFFSFYNFEPKVGMSLNQFLTSKERYDFYKRAFEGEKFTIEDQIPLDGEEKYIEVSYFPIYKNNKVMGASIYLKDITERKRADEELRKTNYFLSALVETMPVAVYTSKINQNYITTYVSSNVYGITGYKPEDFTSNGSFWVDHIHPDDRPKVENALKETLEKGSYEWEYRFCIKNGTYKWIYDWTRLIKNSHGEVEHVVGTWLDINERKMVEEKLFEQSTLLDISPDAIIVTDMNENILFWNKGAERTYGWTKEEALGKKPIDLYFGKSQSKFDIIKNNILVNGRWSGETKQVTKDGNNIISDVNLILMLDNKNQPKSILSVNSDITEKKELESQFLRTQRMESIGSLANGIAHDLNNILTPILMGTEILRSLFYDKKSDRVLSTIESSVRRGTDIIKQILTFSQGTEENELINIEHLIKDIEKFIKETFPKSMQLEIDMATDCWRISGKRTQLYQVLLNLCVNARDAMPNGGKLIISIQNIDIDKNYALMEQKLEEGQYVSIRVSDTGEGIPPEIINKIFESFFTTKEIGKGTGIGLSTVSTIVKNHNGFINVYSEVGKGTTFKIYFPAVINSAGTEKEKDSPELILGSGELILVVDDEAAILDITKETLEMYGYRVLTANDGYEAISLYAQHKNNVRAMVMDINMPLIGGLPTINILKKIDPDVKIIGVSGLSDNEKYLSGMTEYFLEKPFTAVKLIRLLYEIISSQDQSKNNK